VLLRLSFGIHPADRSALLALNNHPEEAAAAGLSNN
jgi:hypothetical protein